MARRSSLSEAADERMGAAGGITMTGFAAPQPTPASVIRRTKSARITLGLRGDAVELLDRGFELSGFELQSAWLVGAHRKGGFAGRAERHPLFLFAVIELHDDHRCRVRMAGRRTGSVDETLG